MPSLQEILDKVIRHMVENQDNGIFTGTPRGKAEKVGVSSGAFYHALYEMGMTRQGQGKTARWFIPKDIIEKYRK